MERVVFNALVKNAPFAAKLSAVKRSRASPRAFRDPLASSLGEADHRQMDTIEQYKIIESQDLGSLAEKVNAALKEGWQPHGAPFIHVSGAAVICCQAMVNFHQPTSAEILAKLRRAAASAFRRGRTS